MRRGKEDNIKIGMRIFIISILYQRKLKKLRRDRNSEVEEGQFNTCGSATALRHNLERKLTLPKKPRKTTAIGRHFLTKPTYIRCQEFHSCFWKQRSTTVSCLNIFFKNKIYHFSKIIKAFSIYPTSLGRRFLVFFKVVSLL